MLKGLITLPIPERCFDTHLDFDELANPGRVFPIASTDTQGYPVQCCFTLQDKSIVILVYAEYQFDGSLHRD